jgi:hypothetical protein
MFFPNMDVLSIRRVLVDDTNRSLVGLGVTVHSQIEAIILLPLGNGAIYFDTQGVDTSAPTDGVASSGGMLNGTDGVTLPVSYSTAGKLAFKVASGTQQMCVIQLGNSTGA